MVYKPLFDEFLTSGNTLQIYEGDRLIFTSHKDRLLPLVDYIERFASNHRNVVIFDKIMGHAAALLCAKANCREVYSPLGSQLAVKALDKYGIRYHLSEIVPYIQKPNREEMCPMEALSIDKEPEEFHQLIKNLLAENCC
jgi:hypothetical protein